MGFPAPIGNSATQLAFHWWRMSKSETDRWASRSQELMTLKADQ